MPLLLINACHASRVCRWALPNAAPTTIKQAVQQINTRGNGSSCSQNALLDIQTRPTNVSLVQKHLYVPNTYNNRWTLIQLSEQPLLPWRWLGWLAHIWCEQGGRSAGSLKTKDTQCSHSMHSFMFFPLLTCGFSVLTPEILTELCEQVGGPFKQAVAPFCLSWPQQHIPATEAPLLWCAFSLATLCRWARWCEMWMESEQAACDRESVCCRALSLIATGIPNDSWSTLLLDCSPKRRRHVHSKHYPSAPSALVLPLSGSKIPPLPPQWAIIFCQRQMCVLPDYPHNTGMGLVCIFHVEWQCKNWAVTSSF